MNRDKEILLLLLRSALWNRPAENLPDKLDWSRLYDLANKQTVTGLLADSIDKISADCLPSEDILLRLRHARVNSIKIHSILNSWMAVRYYIHFLFSGIYHYFKGLR